MGDNWNDGEYEFGFSFSASTTRYYVVLPLAPILFKIFNFNSPSNLTNISWGRTARFIKPCREPVTKFTSVRFYEMGNIKRQRGVIKQGRLCLSHCWNKTIYQGGQPLFCKSVAWSVSGFKKIIKQLNNYIWSNRKQVKFCFCLPIGPNIIV